MQLWEVGYDLVTARKPAAPAGMPMPLSPLELLYAYSQGIFPMAHEDGIYWYDPDPRAILPLDSFHVPRSLQRVLKKGCLKSG